MINWGEGDVKLTYYYDAASLRQMWKSRRLVEPSWETFSAGDKVLAVSAGIILGLVPLKVLRRPA